MKSILLLLTTAGLAVTVYNSQAGDLGSPAPMQSDIDPARRLVVAFTANRWTTDKVLIATGTLTNTNPVTVTVTKIIATGFDKQQNVVAGGPGSPEEASYTIGDAEVDAGATAIFKVALSDPKKAIRFVRARPLIAPIPTPTLNPTPNPTSAETAAAATPSPTAPPRFTVEELAAGAWQQAKMLPGRDGKYNWIEIGMNESELKDFLHTKGLLLPTDDQAFGDAFSAIAHQSEDRLRERAFENSQ